jgi:hypothetical protein
MVLAAGSALYLAGCITTLERIGSAGPVTGSGGPAVSAGAPVIPGRSGPTPVPTFVRPTPTPAPTFTAYVVKSGDNLNTIAHRYGTTARSIAFWNRGTYPSLDPEAAGYRPDVVRLGWTLVLIPNVKFDEQTLPGPTPNPTDPSEAEPTSS